MIRAGDESLAVTYLEQPAKISGPDVVWVHGMGSSRLAFIPLFESAPLPGAYFAPDLPGFGGSTLPRRRQEIPDFVNTLTQFLDRKAIERPFLIGHSFGGMVAAETAIAHPDRVRGVILVSAAGLILPQHAFEPTPWVLVNRVGIWLTSLDYFGNRILSGLGLDPKRVDRESRERMRYGWRRAREMARMVAFYRTPELAPRLDGARVPTALIWGDRDALFPLNAVKREVAGRFPFEVVWGAGHLPFDYDLSAFNRCLTRAFAKICPDAAQTAD